MYFKDVTFDLGTSSKMGRRNSVFSSLSFSRQSAAGMKSPWRSMWTGAGMEARAISWKVLALRTSRKGVMLGSEEMIDDRTTPGRRIKWNQNQRRSPPSLFVLVRRTSHRRLPPRLLEMQQTPALKGSSSLDATRCASWCWCLLWLSVKHTMFSPWLPVWFKLKSTDL